MKVALALVCLVAASAGAQTASRRNPPANQKAITYVALADVSERPGAAVVVQITFTPAEEMKIRRLKLSITYRSMNLRFDRLDRGPAIDPKNLEFRVEDHRVNGEGRSEYTTLTIVAALLSAAPNQAGIPAGVLASLAFRIGEEADGTMITLVPIAEATEVGSNTPLSAGHVVSHDGAVFVLAPGWDAW